MQALCTTSFFASKHIFFGKKSIEQKKNSKPLFAKQSILFQVLPIVSQSSENLSGDSSNTENNDKSKNNSSNKKPVAPPRSGKEKNNTGGIGGIKGSKSSFNLDPRPSSGRPSSSRPGRYVLVWVTHPTIGTGVHYPKEKHS